MQRRKMKEIECILHFYHFNLYINKNINVISHKKSKLFDFLKIRDLDEKLKVKNQWDQQKSFLSIFHFSPLFSFNQTKDKKSFLFPSLIFPQTKHSLKCFSLFLQNFYKQWVHKGEGDMNSLQLNCTEQSIYVKCFQLSKFF